MLEKLLSFLFPPVLPGKIREWPDPTPYRTLADEQGSARLAPRYRDGIERYWAEHDAAVKMKFDLYGRDRQENLVDINTMIAAFDARMTAEEYVNTIHDCWEKEEKGII